MNLVVEDVVGLAVNYASGTPPRVVATVRDRIANQAARLMVSMRTKGYDKKQVSEAVWRMVARCVNAESAKAIDENEPATSED